MPDLKDLTWSVQAAVDSPPFDKLLRRAGRRRQRRRLIVTTCIVIAAALLVTGLNATTHDAPVAPERPKIPGRVAPGSDQKGQELAYSPTSRLDGTLLTSPTRWASAWSDCTASGTTCTFTGALNLDGRITFAPVRSAQMYTLLQAGTEPILAALPVEQGQAGLLVRLDPRGTLQTPLRQVDSTRTFGDDEILTAASGPGSIAVVNPRTSTVRELVFPSENAGLSFVAPVRDKTGRWWLLSGGTRSDILWTDDNGKTWQGDLLDPDHDAFTLSVSPNGKTVVATSLVDVNTPSAIATVKVSTDAGKTWRLVTDSPGECLGGPVALDDGTVLMLGREPGETGVWRYLVTSSRTQRLNAVPKTLSGLETSGHSVYALQSAPGLARVAATTDRGANWSYFVPR